MAELRSFGQELIETVVIAKRFYRHKCFHAKTQENSNNENNNSNEVQKEEQQNQFVKLSQRRFSESVTLSASNCILELIGQNNPHHFLVATQDPNLKAQLSSIPGIPLLSIGRNSFILEKPTSISVIFHCQKELDKMKPSNWEIPYMPTLKSQLENNQNKIKIKKKKKSPNPLSCLKPKKSKKKNKSKEVKKDAEVADDKNV